MENYRTKVGLALSKTQRVGWRSRGCCAFVCPQIFAAVLGLVFVFNMSVFSTSFNIMLQAEKGAEINVKEEGALDSLLRQVSEFAYSTKGEAGIAGPQIGGDNHDATQDLMKYDRLVRKNSFVLKLMSQFPPKQVDQLVNGGYDWYPILDGELSTGVAEIVVGEGSKGKKTVVEKFGKIYSTMLQTSESNSVQNSEATSEGVKTSEATSEGVNTSEATSEGVKTSESTSLSRKIVTSNSQRFGLRGPCNSSFMQTSSTSTSLIETSRFLLQAAAPMLPAGALRAPIGSARGPLGKPTVINGVLSNGLPTFAVSATGLPTEKMHLLKDEMPREDDVARAKVKALRNDTKNKKDDASWTEFFTQLGLEVFGLAAESNDSGKPTEAATKHVSTILNLVSKQARVLGGLGQMVIDLSNSKEMLQMLVPMVTAGMPVLLQSLPLAEMGLDPKDVLAQVELFGHMSVEEQQDLLKGVAELFQSTPQDVQAKMVVVLGKILASASTPGNKTIDLSALNDIMKSLGDSSDLNAILTSIAGTGLNGVQKELQELLRQVTGASVTESDGGLNQKLTIASPADTARRMQQIIHMENFKQGLGEKGLLIGTIHENPNPNAVVDHHDPTAKSPAAPPLGGAHTKDFDQKSPVSKYPDDFLFKQMSYREISKPLKDETAFALAMVSVVYILLWLIVFTVPISLIPKALSTFVFTEKDNKMMHTMQIYGVPRSAYWLSYYLYGFTYAGLGLFLINFGLICMMGHTNVWKAPESAFWPAISVFYCVSSLVVFGIFIGFTGRKLEIVSNISNRLSGLFLILVGGNIVLDWFLPTRAVPAKELYHSSQMIIRQFDTEYGAASAFGGLANSSIGLSDILPLEQDAHYLEALQTGNMGLALRMIQERDNFVPEEGPECYSQYGFKTFLNHFLCMVFGSVIPGFAMVRVLYTPVVAYNLAILLAWASPKIGIGSVQPMSRIWSPVSRQFPEQLIGQEGGVTKSDFYNGMVFESFRRRKKLHDSLWTQCAFGVPLHEFEWERDYFASADVWIHRQMDYVLVVVNVAFWIVALYYVDRKSYLAEEGLKPEERIGGYESYDMVAYNDEGGSSKPGMVVVKKELGESVGGAGADGLPPALEIRNLTKRFSNGVVANDKLSFSVEPGEIFGLLGHNGAGKTTLVNQLTGCIPVTSGDARVAGMSLRKDGIDKVRANVSLCPQENPYWNVFTLREHCEFFARLRGVQEGFVQSRVIEYAKSLGLDEKLDSLCKDLSGGQLRRMWALCALLGNTPLIILDEPTSSMDPQARRDFWIMLKKICKSERRAVIFSTHYLEEADLLAERKIILAHGKLMAIGTSTELKAQWGMGYWITIAAHKKIEQEEYIVGAGFDKNGSGNYDTANYGAIGGDVSNKVNNFQDSHAQVVAERLRTCVIEIVVPLLGYNIDGKRKTNVSEGSQGPLEEVKDLETIIEEDLALRYRSDYSLQFCVPWSKKEKMAVVIDGLEIKKEKYGIQDIHISRTSLEEVFERVGDKAAALVDLEKAVRKEERRKGKEKALLKRMKKQLVEKTKTGRASLRAGVFNVAKKLGYEKEFQKIQNGLANMDIDIESGQKDGKENEGDEEKLLQEDHNSSDSDNDGKTRGAMNTSRGSSEKELSFEKQGVIAAGVEKQKTPVAGRGLGVSTGFQSSLLQLHRENDLLLSKSGLRERNYNFASQFQGLFVFRFYTDLLHEPEHLFMWFILSGLSAVIGYATGKYLELAFYEYSIFAIYLCSGIAIVGARLMKEKEWGVGIHMEMHGLYASVYHSVNFFFYWMIFTFPIWHLFYYGIAAGNLSRYEPQHKPFVEDRINPPDTAETAANAAIIAAGGTVTTTTSSTTTPLPPLSDFEDFDEGLLTPGDCKLMYFMLFSGSITCMLFVQSVSVLIPGSINALYTLMTIWAVFPTLVGLIQGVEVLIDIMKEVRPTAFEQALREVVVGGMGIELAIYGEMGIFQRCGILQSIKIGVAMLLPNSAIANFFTYLNMVKKLKSKGLIDRSHCGMGLLGRDPAEELLEEGAAGGHHGSSPVRGRLEEHHPKTYDMSTLRAILGPIPRISNRGRQKIRNILSYRVGFTLAESTDGFTANDSLFDILVIGVGDFFTGLYESVYSTFWELEKYQVMSASNFHWMVEEEINNYLLVYTFIALWWPAIGLPIASLMFLVFAENVVRRRKMIGSSGKKAVARNAKRAAKEKKDMLNASLGALGVSETTVTFSEPNLSKGTRSGSKCSMAGSETDYDDDKDLELPPPEIYRDPDVVAEEERLNRFGAAVDITGIYKRFQGGKDGINKHKSASLDIIPSQNKGCFAVFQKKADAVYRGLAKQLNPSSYLSTTNECWATKGVTLGVPRGECFVLLGPNGAGKTTLFNMMSGNDEVGGPTRGDIKILDRNVAEDCFASARRVTGLAPQCNRLWPTGTGRQHLRLYAKICGTYWPEKRTSIPGSSGEVACSEPKSWKEWIGKTISNHLPMTRRHIGQTPRSMLHAGKLHQDPRMPWPNDFTSIEGLVSDFGEGRISRFLREVSLSEEDADRPTEEYSGGMKRKISVALTMITDPQICFLDEMSAGVDIVAQRSLWNKLNNRPRGQTIISTTHSMMEADAVCDRIGILVNGRLQCLGNAAQIKARYGDGYHLELVLDIGRGKKGKDASLHERNLLKTDAGDEGKEKRKAITMKEGVFTSTLQDKTSALTTTLQDKTSSKEKMETLVANHDSKNKSPIISTENVEIRILESLGNYSSLPFEQIRVLENIRFSQTKMKIVVSLGSSQSIAEKMKQMSGKKKGGITQQESLSPIFKWCSEDPLNIIEDYSLGEPTLEQVFLKFAKEQEIIEARKGEKDTTTAGPSLSAAAMASTTIPGTTPKDANLDTIPDSDCLDKENPISPKLDKAALLPDKAATMLSGKTSLLPGKPIIKTAANSNAEGAKSIVNTAGGAQVTADAKITADSKERPKASLSLLLEDKSSKESGKGSLFDSEGQPPKSEKKSERKVAIDMFGADSPSPFVDTPSKPALENDASEIRESMANTSAAPAENDQKKSPSRTAVKNDQGAENEQKENGSLAAAENDQKAQNKQEEGVLLGEELPVLVESVPAPLEPLEEGLAASPEEGLPAPLEPLEEGLPAPLVEDASPEEGLPCKLRESVAVEKRCAQESTQDYNKIAGNTDEGYENKKDVVDENPANDASVCAKASAEKDECVKDEGTHASSDKDQVEGGDPTDSSVANTVDGETHDEFQGEIRFLKVPDAKDQHVKDHDARGAVDSLNALLVSVEKAEDSAIKEDDGAANGIESEVQHENRDVNQDEAQDENQDVAQDENQEDEKQDMKDPFLAFES